MPTVFEATGPHYCPDGCVTVVSPVGAQTVVYQKVRLKLIVQAADIAGYAGKEMYFDVGRCPKCGRSFKVRYRVLSITRVKGRDAVPNPKYIPKDIFQ